MGVTCHANLPRSARILLQRSLRSRCLLWLIALALLPTGLRNHFSGLRLFFFIIWHSVAFTFEGLPLCSPTACSSLQVPGKGAKPKAKAKAKPKAEAKRLQQGDMESDGPLAKAACLQVCEAVVLQVV